MKNMKKYLLLFVIAAIVSFFYKIKYFFALDGCLDRGGAWNYETRECDGTRTDHSAKM